MDVPDQVVQWKFGGATGSLRSDTNYQPLKGISLHNSVVKKFLNHQEEHGINLGFDSSEQRKYHLHVPDGKERDILSGESVSLANGGGACHLHYYKTTVGINLGWSAAPHFEWRIFAKGVAVGSPIPQGGECAILNEKVAPKPDWLIYFSRPGGDIGWTSTTSWQDQVKNKLADGAKELIKEAIKKRLS